MHLRSAALPYERAVLQFVCPINAVRGNDASPLGSAFLLKLSSATLLVTAAHVLDNWNTCSLQLLGAKRIIPVVASNQLVFSTGGDDERSKTIDKFDIAFAVLNLSRMAEQPRATPITPADLDLSDRGDPEQLYGFTGFPEFKNQPRRGYFPNHVYFLAGRPAEQSNYATMGLHRDTHFIMTFPRKRMINEAHNLVIAPDPHCMSGGPVFRLGTSDEVRAGTASPKVVALALRWLKEQQLVVAVRIALVVQAVRNALPELARELPDPVHLKANVTVTEP
jgi:hypothetical protein